MSYPSIGDYLDALRAEGSGWWRTMPPHCPALDHRGDAIYSSGNFGVVFRAIDPDGQPCALKCFTRPAAGRAQAYDRLARELPRGADYLVAHRYLQQELTVWHDGQFAPFDVLQMDWVEGTTLHQSIRKAADQGDRPTLEHLFDSFLGLARWLIGSGLAHGDLKPENIIVTPTGNLRLVDYDAMYLPSMAGEAQREVGTPAWQHPDRDQMLFSTAIDHYPIALIGATIEALSQMPSLITRFTPPSGGLLFDPERLVAGIDPALELLKSYGLADRWHALLESPTPELAQLPNALSTKQLPVNKPWVPFEHKGRWGFRRAGTSEEIAPIFEAVHPFSQERAAVAIGNRWGFIDSMGEPVCRFSFHNAWSFTEGLAVVQRGKKYGYIDPEGKVAISARYERARNFSEGYAVVISEGRYGLIDRKGRWMIRPEWEHIANVHHKKTVAERGGEKIEVVVE